MHVVACPHPFSIDRIEGYAPAGLPIADLLRSIGLNPDPIFARVFIDDQLIPKADWEWAVPQAGQLVTVRVIPTGGDGGGKDALRLVAMISVVALAIAAPFGLAALGVGGLTTAAGGLTLGGAALSTAISIGGSLAITALIPPAASKLQNLSSTNLSPTLSLTGSANQLAPYAPIPRVYGRHRVFPPLAARPFTEVVGSDQYLRLLFCVGYGPLVLSDLKIGQTPIEQFTGVELEVRYGFETDAPLTLIPDDVYEDALSLRLTAAGGAQQRRTQAEAREISVDITFPEGLVNLEDSPDFGTLFLPAEVQVQVEYRLVGDVSWTVVNSNPAAAATVTTSMSGLNNDLTFTAVAAGSAGNQLLIMYSPGPALLVEVVGANWIQVWIEDGVTTGAALKAAMDAAVGGSIGTAHAPGNDGTGVLTLSQSFIWQLAGGKDGAASFLVQDNRATLVRANLRFPVEPVGQYDVRLTRVTADGANTRDAVYWTMLRTIQPGSPVAKSGLCLVALRIKATDQLNGTVDQFNCLAQSVLLDWDGADWVLRPTSNPASVYRNILQGSANARPLADSRLDLTTLQDFHGRCETHGFAFNAAIDYRTTVFELARDVLAAGRGSFGLRDGTYSVVEDLPQSTPIQHFTPRNSWGFRGTRTFVDLPHALKLRFVNPDKDWQQDERLVYADGYNEANATKFETLDLLGVTDADQAWKLGRYHLAVAQLRPELYELNVDVEHLVCTRGDLVRVVHDVPLFGAGYGRIQSLATDGGGNATGFTLDDVLTMDGSLSYAVRFRKADGSTLVQQVVTVAGEQSTLTFTVAIPTATKPAVGDLALLGVLGRESVELLVKEIQPGPDLTAKLILVDAAPAVHTADTGSIPAFDSQITLPVAVQTPLPMPLIIQVQSDESVLLRDVDGSYQSRILVTVHFLSGYRLPVTTIEAQYRPTGSTGAWVQLFAPVSGTAVEVSIAPVQDGVTYDLRLRTVDRETGQTSDWALIDAHTVIGKTTPPPDVTGLTFDSNGIRWAYPDPPVDFDGFLIRVRPGLDPIWDDAFQLNDVPTPATSYPLVPDGSTRVIMVKGVDVAGVESANVAWLLQDAAALVLTNLAETIDLQALGFPGTKTNCTVVGDELVADSQTLVWSNDTAQFWSSASALFWNGSYQDLTYVFTVTPSRHWLTGTMRLQLGITAQGWTVEYRPGSSALFWSSESAAFWTSDAAAFWTGAAADWVTWPGSLELPAAQEYEFRISAVGGQSPGVISLLRVLFDMPDLRETFDDVPLAAIGGTRLSLTKAFHVITAVTATLQADGGTAQVVRVLDKQLTPGPLLSAYDDSEVVVAGVVDAVVHGY